MSLFLPAAATALAWMAAGGLQLEARSVLDDPVGVEAMLAQEGIPLEDASVVYGLASRRVLPSAAYVRQDSVGWTTLDDRTVMPSGPSRVPRGETSCQHMEGTDPVPGQRRLHVLRGRPGAGDFRATGGPEIVLATAWDEAARQPREMGWVRLAPGDTVQQLTIEPTGRRGRREVLELRTRKWGQLRMVRDGEGVEVCYDRQQVDTLATVQTTEAGAPAPHQPPLDGPTVEGPPVAGAPWDAPAGDSAPGGEPAGRGAPSLEARRGP